MTYQFDDVNQARLFAQSRGTAKRAEKKAKPTPEAWRRIWLDELKKFYPHYFVAYSDAVAANLKRAVASRGVPVGDVGPLIAWTIANWPMLRKSVLSRNPKFPSGPEAPDMGIVIAQLPRIFGLFNSAKPENALTASRAPVASVAVAPQQPAPKRLPVKPLTRPSVIPLRSHAVDYAKAEQARQRLNLPKWGE